MIRYKMPFCHQSSFTRRSLLVEMPFNMRYKISADYQFFLKIFLMNKKYAYLPEIVAIYKVGGLSSCWEIAYKDMIKVYEEMPVRDVRAIRRIKQKMMEGYIRKFVHQYLWRFIPESIKRRRPPKGEIWKSEEEFFGTKKENP